MSASRSPARPPTPSTSSSSRIQQIPPPPRITWVEILLSIFHLKFETGEMFFCLDCENHEDKGRLFSCQQHFEEKSHRSLQIKEMEGYVCVRRSDIERLGLSVNKIQSFLLSSESSRTTVTGCRAYIFLFNDYEYFLPPNYKSILGKEVCEFCHNVLVDIKEGVVYCCLECSYRAAGNDSGSRTAALATGSGDDTISCSSLNVKLLKIEKEFGVVAINTGAQKVVFMSGHPKVLDGFGTKTANLLSGVTEETQQQCFQQSVNDNIVSDRDLATDFTVMISEQAAASYQDNGSYKGWENDEHLFYEFAAAAYTTRPETEETVLQPETDIEAEVESASTSPVTQEGMSSDSSLRSQEGSGEGSL